MALDHLRAVPQHHQCGDGAEAAGPEVDRGAVVYLAVDHGINQPHHIRRQLRHRRRRLRVVFRPVVAHAEFRRGLVQVGYKVFVLVLVILLQLLLKLGLVGTQVRVIILVVFGGHGIHLVGVSPPP